jgi:hypothetical protein
VYADEPSIRKEYDPDMTHLKQTLGHHERMRLRSVYQRSPAGMEKVCGKSIKKSPLLERASNYFLGGE